MWQDGRPTQGGESLRRNTPYSTHRQELLFFSKVSNLNDYYAINSSEHSGTSLSLGVFDWASSVTYVLTDWTFPIIFYSTGTGNEAM